MQTQRLKWLLTGAVGLAVFMLVGPSVAQNQQRSRAKTLAEENRDLIDEDIDALSNQQMLDRAQKKIKQAKTKLANTNSMLDSARADDKDIGKINCINDKQAAIKGFLKVSEQSYVKLKEATDEGDGQAAKHHYTLIAVSHQKVDKLTQEAQMCAGDIQRYSDETNVEMNVDGQMPDDPEYLSDDEAIGVMDLPELTPYQ
jgi:ABC-type transport system involved in cytochrome bd biosynthesis fused ATPase/permease subunit